MSRKMRLFLIAALALILLAACGGGSTETPPPIGLANPASVFCGEHDGELEIRKDESGAEYGVCIFDDGSECEEWAFYRDECKPGDFETAPVPTP
jgi:putative hemolysin